MRKIKTSDIAAGAAMPMKKGTLDLLQYAVSENDTSILQMITNKGLYGAPNFTTPYALFGLKNTSGGGSNRAITQGALIFGQEIFQCDANLVNVNFGEVVIGTITTTNITATDSDPVTFTNGINHNVHEIRKMVWSSGVSGSGDIDFDDILWYGQWTDLSYSAAYLASDSGTWTLPTTSNFKVGILSQGLPTKTLNIDIQFSSVSVDTDFVILKYGANTNKFTKDFYATLYYSNANNTPITGVAFARCVMGTNEIEIRLNGNSPIKAITAGFNILGQISFELEVNP